MSDDTKKKDKPEAERDAHSEEELDELTEDELAAVAGGAVSSGLDLSRSKLKSSKGTNPVVNVGMEKNDAEEYTGKLGGK